MLKSKFRKSPKIKIRRGCGVITAATEQTFMGMQLLYYSVTLSHDVPFVVVDTGMSPAQRDWCHKEKIEVIIPEKKEGWYKPECFVLSPFSWTVYLDPDVVVVGSLLDMFNSLGTSPFFVADHYYPKVVVNSEELYRKRPVENRSKRPATSAVVGLSKNRDNYIIDTWKNIVDQADSHPGLKSSFAGEHGTLTWTLELLGHTDLIRDNISYNFPVYPRDVDLAFMLHELPWDHHIAHLHGHPKPWSHWEPFRVDPDNWEELLADRLRLFVVGEDEFKTPDLPFMQAVDLNALSIGKHQTSLLGDSRFFHGNLVESTDHEYIGILPHDWDHKYPSALTLDRIAAVRHHLHPGTVLVGKQNKTDWFWKLELEDETPGIMRYLDEIERFTGLKSGVKSFRGNHFICHRDVYRQFVYHWRKVFAHFDEKYGQSFSYQSPDPWRTLSFLYEAVTVHYFSTRRDLSIVTADFGLH